MLLSDTLSGTEPPIQAVGSDNSTYHQVNPDATIRVWTKKNGTWRVQGSIPGPSTSGGGGSFLSANTARVDPGGDDDTGEVGDLNKPFLTVQGAVDAIEALDPIPEWPVIEVGDFDNEEEITTSLVTLKIKGALSWNPASFNDDLPETFVLLTFTEADADVGLILDNCFCPSGDIVANNGDNKLRIQMLNSYLSAIIANGDIDPPGTGNTDDVLVDGGGNSTITDIFCAGDCRVYNFTNPVNVTVGDSQQVAAVNSYISGVNSFPGDLPADDLQLYDSIVTGSNAATTIIQEQNLFIKPPTSDPEIEGVLWNDNGTPAISAGPPP